MSCVKWIRRGRVVWTDRHGGIGSARGAALAFFDQWHKNIGIDRAEVWDDDGQLRLVMPGRVKFPPRNAGPAQP